MSDVFQAKGVTILGIAELPDVGCKEKKGKVMASRRNRPPKRDMLGVMSLFSL